MGNGKDTFFWTGRWRGDEVLCIRFRRLFDLSNNKWTSVADIKRLGWGEGRSAWRWRRSLSAWEEKLLVECQVLLREVPLHDVSSYRWIWSSDPVVGYTMGCIYIASFAGRIFARRR